MLQIVRDNASGLLVKIILWGLVAAFVGTIFLVWGMGDKTGYASVATVGDEAITRPEYMKRYDSILNQIGNQIPAETIKQLNIGQQVIREMVSEVLQAKAAREASITVSKEELQYEIQSNPAFHVSGAFDKDRYFSILKSNRLTPAGFKKNMEESIIMLKMIQMISDNIQVTEQEIKEEYAKANSEVNVRYFTIKASGFEEGMSIPEEQIAEYYNLNKSRFIDPEGRLIELLHASNEKFAGAVNISDEEAKKDYDANIDRYKQSEKIHASHILISVPKTASKDEEDALRLKAEQYLKEIRDGADFSEMAKKYSNGPSAANGGDLGMFDRGTMVATFENAALSLKPGEVSAPVRTGFGFHLIKLNEHQKASTAKFEDVMQEVKKKLSKKQAGKKAKSALKQALSSGKADNWETIASLNGFDFSQKLARRNESLLIDGDSAKLVDRAFSLNKGEASTPIQMKDGAYAIRLVEKVQSRDKDISEVRNQIIEHLKKQKSIELARSKADETVKRLNDGSTLEKEAALFNTKVLESGLIKRGNDAGQVPLEVKNAGFGLKSGAFDIVAKGNEYMIVELKERKDADAGKYQSAREETKTDLLKRKRTAVVSEWKESLWRSAEEEGLIEIRPELL